MTERSPLSADHGPGALQPGGTPPASGGRLGAYTALGACVGVVPLLPWVPDALERRVRGALVHDIASRRGMSLTLEARNVLADPAGPGEEARVGSRVVRYLAWRLGTRIFARLGPVSLVWPLRQALRTYALGHLFDRYLERPRPDRSVRIDLQEARRVRRAIDRAVARAVTVEAPAALEPTVIDDQRPPLTALVDSVIALAAGLPDRLASRLDTAFDGLIVGAEH